MMQQQMLMQMMGGCGGSHAQQVEAEAEEDPLNPDNDPNRRSPFYALGDAQNRRPL